MKLLHGQCKCDLFGIVPHCWLMLDSAHTWALFASLEGKKGIGLKKKGMRNRGKWEGGLWGVNFSS